MSIHMKLEEVDKNFSFESALDKEGLVFYDVRKVAAFTFHGLYEPHDETQPFHRMPIDVAKSVSQGVNFLNFWTAGGRVCFATNSPYIAVRCETRESIAVSTLMSLGNRAGFDLYEVKENGEQVFCNTLIAAPERVGQIGFEAVKDLPKDGRVRRYILNFPCYGSVKNLAIGLHEDAVLEKGASYRYEKPVIFYGSSITQGGSASRPGMTYQAHLGKEFGFDYVNLGFSGNAKGEDPMIDYLASLDPLIFVCDYDANAPTAEHLKATLPKLYKAFRRAHPNTPYVFISYPGEYPGREKNGVVRNIALEAIEGGDQNAYFVEGERIFDGPFAKDCTGDNCHPNDLGFFRMYENIAKTFREILS